MVFAVGREISNFFMQNDGLIYFMLKSVGLAPMCTRRVRREDEAESFVFRTAGPHLHNSLSLRFSLSSPRPQGVHAGMWQAACMRADAAGAEQRREIHAKRRMEHRATPKGS